MKNKKWTLLIVYLLAALIGLAAGNTLQYNWIRGARQAWKLEYEMRIWLSILFSPLILLFVFHFFRKLLLLGRTPGTRDYFVSLLPFAFFLLVLLLLPFPVLADAMAFIAGIPFLVSLLYLLYRYSPWSAVCRQWLRPVPRGFLTLFNLRTGSDDFSRMILANILAILIIRVLSRLLYLNYTFFRVEYIKSLPALFSADLILVLVLASVLKIINSVVRSRTAVKAVVRTIYVLVYAYLFLTIMLVTNTGQWLTTEILYTMGNISIIAPNLREYFGPVMITLLLLAVVLLNLFIRMLYLFYTEDNRSDSLSWRQILLSVLFLFSFNTAFGLAFDKDFLVAGLLSGEDERGGNWKKISELKVDRLIKGIRPYLSEVNFDNLPEHELDVTPFVFKKKKYNIVFWVYEGVPAKYFPVYDDLYDLTPNMKSLMQNAVIFKNYYSFTPLSAKINFSMHSGMYPYLSYLMVFQSKSMLRLMTLSKILRHNGYKNSYICTGKIKYTNKDFFFNNQYYDLVIGKEGLLKDAEKPYSDFIVGIDDQALVDRAFKWLAEVNEPFYMNLFPVDTHSPYNMVFPADYTGRVEDYEFKVEKSIPRREKVRHHRYLEQLKYCDHVLGNFIKGLKERGLYSNTVLFILSDHGENFREHGQQGHNFGIYQESVKVPLVMVNPELFQGQVIDERFCDAVDLLPTILDLMGCEVPKSSIHQGDSLVGPVKRDRIFIFNFLNSNLVGEIKNGKKLIWDVDSGGVKFFDLDKDPYEMNDISPDHPELIEEYKKEISEWLYHNARHLLPAI